MSNALAIASVTAVLKDLLDNGVVDNSLSSTVGEVTVSVLPPDRIELDPEKGRSQLNLYLYQVSPNPGWRNVGLPSHNDRGERVSNPPLALDLHYLLTAYGTHDCHAEILLGYGMQLLHETPVLSRELIRTALAPTASLPVTTGLPANLQALTNSDLAEQVEQIKITPETLSTEELAKLWTVFQAKYRPTAAYVVSVVLIESQRPTRSALPVRARKLYAVPFRHPVIEQIQSQATDDAPILSNEPILAGHLLVIRGQQLRGEETIVRIGGIEAAPDSADVTDTRIVVALPAGLEAGMQGVQVVHRLLMGEPPVSHHGVESNLTAFVLRPRIVEPIGVSDVVDMGGGLRSATVQLTVAPDIGPSQRVVLLLNELVTSMASPPEDAPSPRAYSFPAPSLALASPPGPSATVSVAIDDVQAGTYLARLQVDGAESPLGSDATGRFTSPQVVIP